MISKSLPTPTSDIPCPDTWSNHSTPVTGVVRPRHLMVPLNLLTVVTIRLQEKLTTTVQDPKYISK